MNRIPMPRMSLLLLALGGALVFGHQVADPAPGTGLGGGSGSAVVLTVPAAQVSDADGTHRFVADLPVDDAATPTLR